MGIESTFACNRLKDSELATPMELLPTDFESPKNTVNL